MDDDSDFYTLWSSICENLVRGEDSFKYIVDRTLMRPRALIDCIKICIGVAINRGHKIVTETDVLDGLKSFSYDITQEISREIRDVLPSVKDALFMFIGKDNILHSTSLYEIYASENIPTNDWEKLTDLLLWYGVLGVHDGRSIKYIYNTNYDLSILKRFQKNAGDDSYYYLYPTFQIDDTSFI